ncbi:MAG: 4-(cytidine 5'-diphospho)-2-C-methyl-D-erythritol kinase, partial [Planctomycetota bacterium]
MRTVRISRRSADGFRGADRGEPALTIQAPAKLNLTLDVLGRRDDGFHELKSLMVTVGWFDTLTVSPADALTLSVTGAVGVPTDERNLVIRAARALERAIGRRPGAALRLHKRIPHEAGLGGGSSDAAATLSALNELWQAGLDRAELSEIAATVGSDVPLFLCGAAAAVVRGRG